MVRPRRIQFRDYLSDSGRNLIRVWAEEIPVGARMKLTSILEHLEGEQNWHQSPYVKPLSGPGAGLLEIVFVHAKIQYRPLLFHGPETGEATIVLGAIEKGDRFEPRNAVETAQSRKQNVMVNKNETVPHDYS